MNQDLDFKRTIGFIECGKEKESLLQVGGESPTIKLLLVVSKTRKNLDPHAYNKNLQKQNKLASFKKGIQYVGAIFPNPYSYEYKTIENWK